MLNWVFMEWLGQCQVTNAGCQTSVSELTKLGFQYDQEEQDSTQINKMLVYITQQGRAPGKL